MSSTGRPDTFGPVPDPSWALFLDIDGTLIDIAPTPDSVHIPAELVGLLENAGAFLGGALAVVSGRPLTAIDALLTPLRLPCGAEHGAMVRLADGTMLNAGGDQSPSMRWRERIKAASKDWPGVIVGEKLYSVAVHYRQAPERMNDIKTLLNGLVAEDTQYEVLPARMAFELRHRDLTKARTVRIMMSHPPFASRTPVFVGDDHTDEDGFRVARELGGLGLHVNDLFAGASANVRRWLARFAKSSPRQGT